MIESQRQDQEHIACEKYDQAEQAFAYEAFSDAVSLYRVSGRMYDQLGINNRAFIAFYQALMARRKQYPGFLDVDHSDFLSLDYFEELGDFVTAFSVFEQGGMYYKEKYSKHKYKYLLAKSYKFRRENDLEAGAKALTQLASFVEGQPKVFVGEHYQVENVFKWRMMAAQNRAKMLLLRGEKIGDIAEEYKRVAEACEPPPGSNSPFLEEVKANQSNFYAVSFKFMAFSNLEKRRPTVSDVKKALEHMMQAVDYARTSKEYFGQIDEEKGVSYDDNVRYLSYWHKIFLARVSVIDREFNKAEKALESAVSHAGYFKASGKEDRIFPNYYADFDDLKNENLVVSAFKALVIDRDTVRCGDFLKQWIDVSKEKHLGSWRFNNVYIRYLVTSALTLIPFLRDHWQRYREVMGEMEKVLECEFVGSASRTLATLVKDIVKFVDGGIIAVDDAVYEGLFDKVCDLFPIESTSRDFRTTELARELPDPFLYLPEYFAKCFRKPENLDEFSSQQIKELCQTVLDGFRHYLVILTEYHYKLYLSFKQQAPSWLQSLPDNFDINFGEMELAKLKFSLGQVCTALGKRPFQSSFDDVEELFNIISGAFTPDVGNVEEIFRIIANKVIPKTYMHFFPHVIQVTRSYEIEGTNVYTATRMWSKGAPHQLSLFGLGLTLEEGAYYYLKPRWKRIGRESVNTTNRQFYIAKSDLYSSTMAKVLTEQASNLKEKLFHCPPGRGSWRDYEEICMEILTYLFVPPLERPIFQPRTGRGLLRRDALFSNCVEQGFWNRIVDRYAANFILFEFKNTDKLKPSDVDKTVVYLQLGKRAIGRFGIILSRKPPSQPALNKRRAWFASEEAVVLLLVHDDLLLRMLELREAGRDPVEILQVQYENLLTDYEP